jgi:hypothetical protein
MHLLPLPIPDHAYNPLSSRWRIHQFSCDQNPKSKINRRLHLFAGSSVRFRLGLGLRKVGAGAAKLLSAKEAKGRGIGRRWTPAPVSDILPVEQESEVQTLFTYKFVGLTAADLSSGSYYYGSLHVKGELGQIIVQQGTGTRYAVVGTKGEPLIGDNISADQEKLAWAEINRGEDVPTLFLQKLGSEIESTGRSFDYDEVKEYSQMNREIRLSASA